MTSETPLRTGVLFKKGSGTGPFGRRNWKPRYFVLTPRKLSYYTYEDGELKGEVDLTGCTDQSIEVMPADSMKTGSSASTIWRIAINAADRRLIVAAGTESEMNEWVEQLLIAFHVNSGQPMPQRRSTLHALPIATAPGAIAHTHMDSDFSRNSITDFQNFAVARRSVGGAVRASLGAHPGHEFRLSDEYERQKQAEQQRMEEQRQLAAMEAERLREEELLQAHLRSQAEERRKEKERREEQGHGQPQTEEKEQERRDSMLEEQRRLKREQHERERQEAERQLRQLELEEEEKRHENEIQSHFEQEHQVVEIHRPAHQVVEIQRPAPSSPARSPVANRPPRSPVRSPVGTPASPSYRSPVIDEAKKDAMMRQQAEHTKRREATIRDQQKQPEQDIGPHHDNHAHLNHASPSSPAKMSSQASVEF